MEYEAGEYRKLPLKQYPARTIKETAEGKYWKQFKAPVFAKQVSRAVRLSGQYSSASTAYWVTLLELLAWL